MQNDAVQQNTMQHNQLDSAPRGGRLLALYATTPPPPVEVGRRPPGGGGGFFGGGGGLAAEEGFSGGMASR